MVKDASGRSDFEFLSDLRDGGGVAILPDGDREKFVDALLPGSEIGKHGTSILKIILVYNIPATRRLINVAISLIYQLVTSSLQGRSRDWESTQIQLSVGNIKPDFALNSFSRGLPLSLSHRDRKL
jgi:hypothetical protein